MSVKITKDGRTIRTGKDYTEFRYELWMVQEHVCINCNAVTSLTVHLMANNSFHVHHINGRGMGGSRRDDTFRACDGLCGSCHRKEHNQ